MGHRKMPAYGEREHGGRYVLDDYMFSRNHNKAVRIRRWKRDLKKRARAHNREVVHQAMQGEAEYTENRGLEITRPLFQFTVF